jgi:predicted glycogen debranching enzyme
MPFQHNSVIIKYELLSKKPCTLRHIPILNSRHFYDVNGANLPKFEVTPTAKKLIIKPGNIDKILTIYCPNTSYEPIGLWNNIEYEIDHRRHDSYQDNNFILGELTHPIKDTYEYYLQLSIEEGLVNDPQLLFSEELSRKKQIVLHAQLPQSMSPLVLSADSFIVRRKTKKSIIAGYHWFSDWGRDSLIALPGITLVTKRFEDAHNILLNFSQYCLRGLIPNTFTDRESLAVYNTVDASLWYIDRIFQYLKYTNDLDTIKHLWPTLTSIIEHYKNGTDFDIHLDKDGCIAHGPGLTWMDVKHGDYYPTPRSKKAVEIQALWFNALKIMEILSEFLGKKEIYSELADHLATNFQYNNDQIYDVIDIPDASIRPNQIFLASLDFSPLSHQTQRQIVDEIERHLQTIFGLRTLSPDDEKYKGSYFGPYHRDFAYHNGMVWPWLLGSFISAYVKTHHHTSSARQHAFTSYLEPMMRIFGEHWDGSIPEIFDGDPPFVPRGCINQAWSVAEILRVWVEDIENIRPSFEKTVLHEVRV